MKKNANTGELSRAISRLNGRTQMEAFETAKSLYAKVNPDVDRQLVRILRLGRRPFNRAAAAHLMQFVPTHRTLAAQEKTVSDISESARVRAEAAEALAHAHRKESHDVLLRNLEDRSKDVRFWCAFSLGQMAELRAVPALERLANADRRVVRGFHSVAKEAMDALQNIRVENKGHRRKNGCVFCTPS